MRSCLIIRSTLATPRRSTSPLLRLPPELRNRIYYFVFSGYEITVSYTTLHPGVGARAIDNANLFAFSKRTYEALRAPTLTCRQFYEETHLLLYKYSAYYLIWNHQYQRFAVWLNNLDAATRATIWAKMSKKERKGLLRFGYEVEK